jgi:hypothetical protein
MVGLALVVAVVAIPSTIWAIPACDNFGRNWNVTLGPFGGTYPGTLNLSGARDTDNAIGCGPAPLFGVGVITAGSGGAPFSILWSMTTFDDPTDNCLTVGWRGTSSSTNITNISGDFQTEEPTSTGQFTLTLGASECLVGQSGADPSVQ